MVGLIFIFIFIFLIDLFFNCLDWYIIYQVGIFLIG